VSPLVANERVPMNPYADATVMVNVAEEPALALILDGLAATVKSWTVTVTAVE